MTISTHDRIVLARVRMLEREPFFGLVAAKLDIQPDESVNETYTDGVRFSYNPTWAASASFDALMTAVAKAACHCALLHPIRRSGRDYKTWQQACNQVVFHALSAAEFPLPKDFKLADQYKNKSAEECYAELYQAQPPQQQGGGKGKGQGQDQNTTSGKKKGNGQGNSQGDGDAPDGQNQQPQECRDQPSKSGGQMSDSERIQAEQDTLKDMAATMHQATEISGAGLPGNLKQQLNSLLFPKMDWLSLVKDFVSKQTQNDYTYSRYSKRGWCLKPRLYLPAMRDIGALETLVFAVDTSISMNERKLQIAGGGLVELMDDLKFERLIVIYCDARIQRVDEFQPGEPIEVHAVGRGNTSLIPPFQYLEREGITPDVLIYFTDLGGNSPDQEPPYPVIWLDQDGLNEHRMQQYKHTFGRYIPMSG